ncbi:MAG: cell division protein FtsQ/DivIB [Holosporales bacterium]|jgi:cell division protein FtsQ|nr:cell division protein FtsQ/DivIB [Holosporales bacterium]
MAKKKINKRKKENKLRRRLAIICPLFSFVVGSIYFFSNSIFSFFNNILDSSLKFSGLVLNSINISGANSKVENLIKDKLKFEKGDNIFKLSMSEIYQRIKEIGWIKEVVIKKFLPNTLDIKIVQKTPVAIFQHNSTFTIIDEKGNYIEDITPTATNLPIVAGEDANINVGSILESIAKYEIVKTKLNSLAFIRKRRWDIFICGGIQIKLPDNNIDDALSILSIILKQNNFNKKTIKSIDIRTKDNVIINGLKFKENKNSI